MVQPDPPVSLARIGAATNRQELAELLRALRRRQARQRGGPELTYRELAAKTGWSLGTVAGYFSGRLLPPTDRFDVLVSQLHATPVEQGALATARDRAQDSRRQAPAPAPSAVPANERPAPERPVPRQLTATSPGFTGR